MPVSAEQKKALKAQGFLCNRDGELFNVRVITGNGVLSSDELDAISAAARQYGSGEVALTSRLTAEIMGVPLQHVEGLKAALAKAGLETGGTGNKVRPVVACKGTVCVFGLIDTQTLAQEIHERFYKGYRQVTLPHKFKIAVGGCPNNCVKPDLNDLGIVGQRVPSFKQDICRGCGKCTVQNACPSGAVVRGEGGVTLDTSACTNCGRCVGKCVFGAVEEGTTGYKLYIGGRWGKKTRLGTPLEGIFDCDQVLEMIEKAILLFKREGTPGERFGNMIDRIGIDKADALLRSNELLEQKQAILEGDHA
nr:(4Fe-4S)-binding protein [bacterium]